MLGLFARRSAQKVAQNIESTSATSATSELVRRGAEAASFLTQTYVGYYVGYKAQQCADFVSQFASHAPAASQSSTFGRPSKP